MVVRMSHAFSCSSDKNTGAFSNHLTNTSCATSSASSRVFQVVERDAVEKIAINRNRPLHGGCVDMPFAHNLIPPHL